MPDLGTLTVKVENNGISYLIPGHYTGYGPHKVVRPNLGISNRIGFLQGVAASGTFSGTVKEGGVAVPNAVVRVYERASGFFVAQTKTNALGEFQFTGQRQGVNDYYVIALDPDGGALYNGLIFDRVAPV